MLIIHTPTFTSTTHYWRYQLLVHFSSHAAYSNGQQLEHPPQTILYIYFLFRVLVFWPQCIFCTPFGTIKETVLNTALPKYEISSKLDHPATDVTHYCRSNIANVNNMMRGQAPMLL